MGVKRQQVGVDQGDLFDQALMAAPRHSLPLRRRGAPPVKAELDLVRVRTRRRKRPRHGSRNEP